MCDTSDFTFCQVASNSDNDLLESPKIIPDIGDITIKDSASVSPQAGSGSSSVLDGGSNAPTGPGSTASSTSTRDKKNEQDAAGLKKAAVDLKPIARKPVARAKVPYEKGFSQMDWMKLTRTHPDLAGLKGQSNRKLISINEVRQHNAEGSIWTVLRGRVYNISPYMKFHPGGVDMLMKAAGKDCTSLFNKYHAWVNAEFLLEKCLVGILDESL